VAEEAVAAGITDIIIVTGAHKRSIEDHFDNRSELETSLRESGKNEIADQLKAIADMANFVYVRQKGPAGSGTPILNVAHLLNDEPFLVLFGDDLYLSEVPRSVQLVKEYERLGRPVIAATKVAKEDASKYGMIDIKAEAGEDLFELAGLIEKPVAGQEPSEFASVSGYILTPDIITILREQKQQEGREFYLADAINTLAKQSSVYAKVVEGRWMDVGDKEKYLEAIVDIALADPELGAKFRAYLDYKLEK
jgi:UTP--glucose-1-phosphate uridylyltransferase